MKSRIMRSIRPIWIYELSLNKAEQPVLLYYICIVINNCFIYPSYKYEYPNTLWQPYETYIQCLGYGKDVIKALWSLTLSCKLFQKMSNCTKMQRLWNSLLRNLSQTIYNLVFVFDTHHKRIRSEYRVSLADNVIKMLGISAMCCQSTVIK